jgi:tRNA modification GTPase
MQHNDTIVAVATPPGMGGIGVVRMSGNNSLRIALACFKPKNKTIKLDAFPARTAVYGSLLDTETNTVLDHCILTYFQSGASYTGEKVVEISCHGSRPILRRAVQLFSLQGARPSGPGEFTLRAVLAGRLDLTQAEAINRLIRADTLVQAEAAVHQLEGSVSKQVFVLEEDLLNTIAAMEAEVDFAEEDENYSHREHVKIKLNSVLLMLAEVISGFQKADNLRDGAVVVIAGKSNAGKSTLFNAILSQERAIVDSVPGTTRDFISEKIDLNGLPVTLYDTAGLRKSDQVVEVEGMKRSEKLILSADLVLHVLVAGDSMTEEDERISNLLQEKQVPIITVWNKDDLESARLVSENDISVSALQLKGIERLKKKIRELLHIDEIASERSFVTEKRQQQLFLNVEHHIQMAMMHLENEMYDEVILQELNDAMYNLSEITGRGGNEEILGRIFSSFCIGK